MNGDINGNGEGVVRKVLKHELTWIVFIIAGLWGFVTSVVLPIQKMQIQITQIQEQITENKQVETNIIKDHQSFTERLGVLETEIKTILKQ